MKKSPKISQSKLSQRAEKSCSFLKTRYVKRKHFGSVSFSTNRHRAGFFVKYIPMKKALSLKKEELLHLGQLLRELRKTQGLSQKEAALFLGQRSNALISRIEHGSPNKISPRSAVELLHTLSGTDLDKNAKVRELIDSVPALRGEERFRELIAERGRSAFGIHGAKTWLILMTGLSRVQIERRLRRGKEGE